MAEKERLFEEFPPVSAKEWTDKIISDLKGADFSRKLVWKTREGFEVMPFYRSEDFPGSMLLPGEKPWIRGGNENGNHWFIRQDITVDDYRAAAAKALDILMRGVDSLGFNLSDPSSVSEKNIEMLLSGISLPAVEINFRSEGMARELVKILAGLAAKTGTAYSEIKGAIEADPLGRLMKNGKLCVSVGAGFDYLSDLVKDSAQLPALRVIEADASHFGNSGADIVTELAFGLAMGNEYLAQLTGRGVDPSLAASKIRFRFSIGSSYFAEIAKLRAARLLWASIAGRYSLSDEAAAKMEIHSVTTRWNKTVFDPYVNMLRTQTEAMSAILGGCNSLTVEAFDASFRKPDAFSERIARNQQLLLKEEAYFDKVADPAGGSYYIEKLTELIAKKAWELFVSLEEEGGFLKGLEKGSVQARIKELTKKRKSDIGTRKEILLGTNQYPEFNVTLPKNYSPEERIEETEDDLIIEKIQASRGAEEFEKLRMAALKAEKAPLVFMLTIGNNAMRRARAQFSCNFFACGGYRVADNPGFNTAREGVDAAIGAGAAVIVVCSSDEEYAAVVPEVYALTAGKAAVVVAGNPECAAELKEKGIEHFISIRSDVASTLAKFHELTGIEKGKEEKR